MDIYLSVKEICILLKVSRQAVCLWIKAGRLKAYKAGKAYRILTSDLENFLKIK